MTDALLHAVRRHSEAHADPSGVARTPIPGLTTIRATTPSELDYAISRPLVALVLQGAKHVTMGDRAFAFGAGDSLLIAADVPTVSRITRASRVAPYFSLVLDLNSVMISELMLEMAPVSASSCRVQVEPTWAAYCPPDVRAADWRHAPLAAPDLVGTPSTYIAAAGHDPTKDGAIAYAQALRDADCPGQPRGRAVAVPRPLARAFPRPCRRRSADARCTLAARSASLRVASAPAHGRLSITGAQPELRTSAMEGTKMINSTLATPTST